MVPILAQLALCASLGAPQDDLSTIEGTVNALYGVISGPAGQKRDWDRFRKLFVPEAAMIATGRKPDKTVYKVEVTPEIYATKWGPLIEKDGFFEKGVKNNIERYDNLAHVFSTYESRKVASDLKPLARGINSIQLWNDGTRWWILSIAWRQEDAAFPIPKEFLPGR